MVAEHRCGACGATQWWGHRRVAGWWFNVDSGDDTSNLGFGVARGHQSVRYRIWWGGGSRLGDGR
jgi:hypothetical protein